MQLIPEPPRKQVNVTRMIIYSFIPILSIYAGWRIQKFWVLVIINVVLGYGAGFVAGVTVPAPYSTVVSLAIVIPISVFVVRHYARKYNEKIASTTTDAAGPSPSV